MIQENIIKQLDVAFKDRATKPSQCITLNTQNDFYIDDNEEAGCCIVLENPGVEFDTLRLFKITNSKSKSIALWAVDGHFFQKGKGPAHCDCIFFDDKDFCFSEFKLNATSTNLETIKGNREKAIDQLRNMIKLIDDRFTQYSYNYLGYKLEAYLCTPETYPHKNTAISDFAVEFIEDYGVSLFEQNYKVFI